MEQNEMSVFLATFNHISKICNKVLLHSRNLAKADKCSYV